MKEATLASLDRIDRRILQALQQSGRLSNQELAEQVGLSQSPCWRRVRQLEEAGVIERYVALLNPKRVGFGVNVFVQITFEKHSEAVVREFEQTVLGWPEVLECYAMSGESDYMLRVAVGDVEEYAEFFQRKLFHLKGVAHIHSKFALKQIKYTTALPIPDG